MKFASKITLCITLLITVLLAAGSIVSVRLIFNNSLNTALEHNLQQLTVEQYALESNLLNYLNTGEPYSEKKAADFTARFSGYGDAGKRKTALLNNSGKFIVNELAPVHVSEEDLKTLSSGKDDNYLVRKGGDKTYMLISTTVDVRGHSLNLVCGYDISHIFKDRQKHAAMQLMLNIILILVTAAAVRIMSLFLTKPIYKLNRISRRIADGAYQERTNIRTSDEFGELSKNFDYMASTVEEKIQEQAEDLERKDEFIAAFTHEIKTPATSILGHADMLRTSPLDAEEQKEIGGIIYREGKRLEHLSGQLMILLGIRDEQVDFISVPIHMLIERTIHTISLQYPDIHFADDAAPCSVYAAPELIVTVLSNLITNAVRANPKDAAVAVRGHIQEDRYSISVIDRGDGIPQSELDKITELFYMVDKSRSRAAGGAGIGLYLCKNILKLHGSALSIQSRQGEGTSVSFSLEVYHA